jgi:hypothetical protein
MPPPPLTYILNFGAADYDLTGQLVWPGAVLMNTYLSEHPETVKGRSIIELGSGIGEIILDHVYFSFAILQKLTYCDLLGITGILCSRFCKEVVLTDHNDEVLEARFNPSEYLSLICSSLRSYRRILRLNISLRY